MKYINNGPKQGTNPNYIAVNGKRVYVGEEFEATENDVARLQDRFDITPVSKATPATPKKAVKETVEVETFSNDSDEDDFEFQTEEDAEESTSFFNISNNILNDEKGVK
jgi:hypothetical protein